MKTFTHTWNMQTTKDKELQGGTGEHHGARAACPDVPLHGIPGFHVVEEEGDHVRMATMKMDPDAKGRVNTGTGDQPSNHGRSRFATPSAGGQ